MYQYVCATSMFYGRFHSKLYGRENRTELDCGKNFVTKLFKRFLLLCVRECTVSSAFLHTLTLNEVSRTEVLFDVFDQIISSEQPKNMHTTAWRLQAEGNMCEFVRATFTPHDHQSNFSFHKQIRLMSHTALSRVTRPMHLLTHKTGVVSHIGGDFSPRYEYTSDVTLYEFIDEHPFCGIHRCQKPTSVPPPPCRHQEHTWRV